MVPAAGVRDRRRRGRHSRLRRLRDLAPDLTGGVPRRVDVHVAPAREESGDGLRVHPGGPARPRAARAAERDRHAARRPRTPRWMCDAVAFPVSPWKLRRQESLPPAPLRTSVALKVPPAVARTPAGFGTSCAALSRAMKPVLAALCILPGDAQASPEPGCENCRQATAPTMNRRFPTRERLRAAGAGGFPRS